jgi:carbamoyltransferase
VLSILGISAFYHDSAACLVQDGRLVAAAQEERFTRVKHDQGFPNNAIEYCLAEGRVSVENLDNVVFYDKPLLKFERILETYIAYAPAGFRQFAMGLPQWLKQKLHLPREMDRALGGKFGGRYVFVEHHESHAASAFFPSPFDEAAIMTLDGVGEWATASLGVGRGNRIDLDHELRFPHSLGLLYSAFTYFTGFRVNSGEYKLMGLAPYGEPRYFDLIMEELLDLKPDGSFRLDLSYFAYCQSNVMTSPKMAELFHGPARAPESPLTQREMDIAASIQRVTEEVMLRTARHLHELTNLENLVMAGGVALNCVGNGRVLREGPFKNVWIQPAAGDAGGALGAALFVWHQLRGQPRSGAERDSQSGSMLGPGFSDEEVRSRLDALGAVHTRFDEETEIQHAIADHVAAGRVVGHMAGRMEFGPRALGNRSILGDARSADMQATMNLKIKFRESFRPFAPIVMREHVDEYFETRKEEDSPYMLLVAPLRLKWRTNEDLSGLKGLDKLRGSRSEIPAVTHVDYSARLQTVDAERHPRLHGVLSRFRESTGCPVMINTSFNVRGEPIVCTPEDAWRCFMATNMDVLVVERYLLRKEDQPGWKLHETNEHLSRFSLD